MLLTKEVKVEILGHQATIKDISVHQKESWQKEDHITVWLELDEPADGTIGFGILIPMPPRREYQRDEFLNAVKREGKNDLARMIKENKRAREYQKQKEARQKELETVVENIVAQL